MATHRRSILQARIMLQLEQNPAKSVTSLANKLEVERSSVSRSLHSLREQGMVVRDDQGWRLSEQGISEIPNIGQAVAKTLEDTSKMTDRATRIVSDLPQWNTAGLMQDSSGYDRSRQELMRIAKQQQTWVSSVLPKLTGFESITALSSALKQIEAMAYPPLPSNLDIVGRELRKLGASAVDFRAMTSGIPDQALTEALSMAGRGAVSDLARFSATLTPLLDMQDRVSDVVRSMTSSIDLMPAVKPWLDNNLLVSHAIDEIRSTYESVGRLGLMFQTVDFDWIARNLADVNQAYGVIMKDRFAKLDRLSLILPDASAHIVPPTASVSYFARSSHEFIRAELPESDTHVGHGDSQEEFGAVLLDDLLAQIDPSLVEKRQGVWSAYNRRGADWIRQASVSQRELIVHLLDKLVPRDTIHEDDAPRIVQQVKALFGRRSSDSDFASALGKAIQEHYRQHNKYTHGDERRVASFRALLHSTEWWLVFILESSRSPDD